MREKRLAEILKKGLQPRELNIENQSGKHRGHAGDDGSGESHFHIMVRAEKLAGLSLLEQHRVVYGLLQSELGNGLHALALDTGG